MTYNAVLKEDLPDGCNLLGFADDTLVVVAAETIGDLERWANRALKQIDEKIFDLGLQIATEKTEAVLFTGRYKLPRPTSASEARRSLWQTRLQTWVSSSTSRACLRHT